MVYALDPDADGELLLETRAGSGGNMGGIHYGMLSLIHISEPTRPY